MSRPASSDPDDSRQCVVAAFVLDFLKATNVAAGGADAEPAGRGYEPTMVVGRIRSTIFAILS